MPPRAFAGLLLVLACSPHAPQPEPVKATTKSADTPVDPKPAPQRTFTAEELDKIGPRPAPVPPLTQEELDILAADPATLSREDRVKQAHARRRKALQNPDSPTARRIEGLRIQMQNGELPPPPKRDAPNEPNEPIMSPPEPPAKAP